MPSTHQKNGKGSVAAAGGEDAAQTSSARIDDAKGKAADVYNSAEDGAKTYLEKGKQAGEHAKDSAKDAAASIQQKTHDAVDSAKETAQPYVDQVKQTAQPYVEKVKQTAQPYVEKAKQTAQPYVEKAKQTAQPYVDQAKQTAQPYVDKAKQTAQPYVDQAKQTAQPYVDQAKQTAQPYVDKAQAVKRSVNKSVEDANNFDITKSTFFKTLIMMAGSVLAWIWICVGFVSPVKVVVVAIRDKASAVGLSEKLWEAYYYSTVILEHVPVVGYRSAEVLRTFVEQTADEARKQIRRKEVESTKKQK